MTKKLKTILPMSSAMYCNLINNYLKNTSKCCACTIPNGECAEIAAQGRCKAFNGSLNSLLVFKGNDLEFTTTRAAIAHVLEVNQENSENPWIGETVNSVIEDYRTNQELGRSMLFLFANLQ